MHFVIMRYHIHRQKTEVEKNSTKFVSSKLMVAKNKLNFTALRKEKPIIGLIKKKIDKTYLCMKYFMS